MIVGLWDEVAWGREKSHTGDVGVKVGGGRREDGSSYRQKDQELASRITGNISPERWLMIVPSHHISPYIAAWCGSARGYLHLSF